MRAQLFAVFLLLTEAAMTPEEDLASVRSVLKHFEVLPLSALHSHSVRRRDVQTETHLEKVLSFHALQRHFRLYLRTNDQLFAEEFSAVVVEQDGRERPLQVNPLNYFSGHVIGEENSRVQAHIDGAEFSAHILTDRDEYNVEVRPWTAGGLDRTGLDQEEFRIQTQTLALVLLLNWWTLIIFILIIKSQHQATVYRV